jgi:hypothetical protein
VRRPRFCFSRTRWWAGSPNNFKRLVNFLNLRKNAKIPLAGIGETDEIPVKLVLEVGKRRPDRFSGGVSVIARVIEGLAVGIYPGRAHVDALISFLRGDGLLTIDVALVPHLARAVVDDAVPAKITTIGHDDATHVWQWYALETCPESKARIVKRSFSFQRRAVASRRGQSVRKINDLHGLSGAFSWLDLHDTSRAA